MQERGRGVASRPIGGSIFPSASFSATPNLMRGRCGLRPLRAGAIYVKEGETYLGKIAAGRSFVAANTPMSTRSASSQPQVPIPLTPLGEMDGIGVSGVFLAARRKCGEISRPRSGSDQIGGDNLAATFSPELADPRSTSLTSPPVTRITVKRWPGHHDPTAWASSSSRCCGAGSGIICISVCVETYGTKP